MTNEEKTYINELIAQMEAKIITASQTSASKGADTMIKKEIVYKGLTIKYREDGRYWVRFRQQGKQISLYGKSPDEVLKKLRKALKFGYEVQQPKPEALPELSPIGYSFYEWLDFWNETYKKPFNKTDNISKHIKNHIKPNINDKSLDKITSIDLQLIINTVETSRTMIDVKNVLKNAMETAYNNKIIKDNPATCLLKISHIQKKGEALTRAEEKQFIKDISGTPCEKLFKFYILTGVRRAEALSLKACDVDVDTKRIKIKGTKTASSYRYIPLFDKVAILLQSITPDENGFYFPFQINYPTRQFKFICPAHKLHDLRHTFATRCLENGVNMKQVQKWLGHADFETTANVYSSIQSDYQSEQADLINKYLDTHFDTQYNDQNNKK